MSLSSNSAVEPSSNPALKRTGNFISIATMEPVANHFGEERAKIQLTAREWKRICVGRRRMAGKSFQPHRGLSLESNFASETQERRGCVEEPSHGSSFKTANICAHQLRSVAIARW